jgi:glycosyltransferase involved in cell wall biosynthesis
VLKRGIFVVWGPFGHRMDELSQIAGGLRVNITLLYGPRYAAPLRYFFLFFKTLILLITKDPEYVYAQNPPVFCPLTCLIYCSIFGKRLFIDHHSLWSVKTVYGIAGKIIGFIERFCSIASRGNSAPHSIWAEKIKRMGAKVIVIHDFVEKNTFSRDESLRNEISVSKYIAISSHGGHPLERIEDEIKSVSGIKDVTLIITGPEEKLSSRLSKIKLPENVRYVGFLPMEKYLRLKASCDFALNITDEPFTLSHVLFEYVASSLAVISSKQDVVYSVFGDSFLYTESSPEKIREKINFLIYNGKLLEYRKRSEEKWYELERKRKEEVLSFLRMLKV